MIECLLCKRPLTPTTLPTVLLHDEAEDCLVRVADNLGVSLDHEFEVRGEEIWHRAVGGEPEPERFIQLTQFYPIEKALVDVFTSRGLERLGGQSSGSGWSNISLFQRCPYAWMRRYLAPLKIEMFGIEGEIVPLAIGSLVHTFLAVYYYRMMYPDYSLDPGQIHEHALKLGCDPTTVAEGWRLFTGYRLYYKDEEIQPLAVEYDLKDPRTGDSCRYDLVAFFPKERPGFLPGTYSVEHKTASRFDSNTLEAWSGDGEILGQVDLWERLHLHQKFGPLRGAVINLLGKQKVAQFHRTIVSPSAFAIEQHRHDLKRWKGLIQLAKGTDVFPRSRNNCIGRYGRCSLWDHCNSGEGA